ncbi:MAG: Gfo/Idh/MocA family oxidoreductase [Nitrososphaera sp.]|jgi:predicted dehydrogenase
MIPRIVLVGTGRFGKNHLRNLILLDKKKVLKLVGVVDVDKKTLLSIEKEYKVKTSTQYRDFLEIADAFDVVTPAATHYKIVKFFLKNNKHVFVEKPLSFSTKEAKELTSLAKQNRKILQVGHIFRYNSAIDVLKKIIKKQGAPFLIKGEFLQSREPKSDVGAIFNYLHLFDILDNILEQQPLKIRSYSNLFDKIIKKETNATVFLQYRDTNVILNMGWIPSGKYRTLNMYFKKNHVICDLEKQVIELYENNKLKTTISPKHKEPLLLELDEFARCVRTNKQPKASGLVGTRVVNMAESATRALDIDKSMPVFRRVQ